MEFEFEGKCVLRMEHKQGWTTSKHVETKINVDVSKPLDRKMYLDKNDLPTKEGSQVLTQVFVQGLVANIHASHQKGFRDSAEHLRYVLSELERGFIQVTNVDQSRF